MRGTVLARKLSASHGAEPMTIGVWVAGERDDTLERYMAADQRLRALARAKAELPDAVRQAHADGMTEADIVRASGVSRMTVRKWIGKAVGSSSSGAG